MFNTHRYIELSDQVLRKLATIQAQSQEEWFEQAQHITTVVEIHDFKTLWEELREYGSEIQYLQQRESDSDLNDMLESRLEHIIILAQRIKQISESLSGV